MHCWLAESMVTMISCFIYSSVPLFKWHVLVFTADKSKARCAACFSMSFITIREVVTVYGSFIYFLRWMTIWDKNCIQGYTSLARSSTSQTWFKGLSNFNCIYSAIYIYRHLPTIAWWIGLQQRENFVTDKNNTQLRVAFIYIRGFLFSRNQLSTICCVIRGNM